MLRDESGNGGGRRRIARNVLGEPLELCSVKPMSGFFRDGCCDTSREDIGSHTVCAVMTAAFLTFSKSCGNDLSTPVPEFDFPETGGAFVRHAGRKHLKRVRRPASPCVPRMKVL